MGLKRVVLNSDVYLVCVTHALSTEHEEIMGLLIGEVDENEVCHVSALRILRRLDKLPDRVEISPEQQSEASIYAEELSQKLKRPMRVVGWYHSHPHITVWPSHVDVRTQANYQQMDSSFVGLIFSVFVQDKVSKQNKIQLTCFQSKESAYGLKEVYVPLSINPTTTIESPCVESLVSLPNALLQEENEAYNRVCDVPQQSLLTQIQNSSVYVQNTAHVLEVISGPILNNLENRLTQNKERIQELKEEKTRLIEQIKHYEQRTIDDM